MNKTALFRFLLCSFPPGLLSETVACMFLLLSEVNTLLSNLLYDLLRSWWEGRDGGHHLLQSIKKIPFYMNDGLQVNNSYNYRKNNITLFNLYCMYLLQKSS